MYIKSKPISTRLIIYTAIGVVVVGLVIAWFRYQRLLMTPSECTVTLAVVCDRNDQIYLLNAGRLRSFGERLRGFHINRLIGYDKESQSILLYGYAISTEKDKIVLYDGKRMSPVYLKGVHLDDQTITTICFQGGKIIVPGIAKDIPSARIFCLDGKLERNIVYRIPSNLHASRLNKVLMLRDGTYALVLDVDKGLNAIVLCDSKGKAIRTLGQGYNISYDSKYHRILVTDDINAGNITVIDLKTNTRKTIFASHPPYYIVRIAPENLDSISAAPDSDWVVASYQLDDWAADQSLYAISIDRNKQIWCKLRDYVLPGQWLPIDNIR